MPADGVYTGRPRSITVDSLMPPSSTPAALEYPRETRKPRSNSYSNLLTSPVSPSLEFAGRYKIVVVGDNDCGKTCLLNAFSKRHYEIDTALTYDEGVLSIRYGSKQVEFVIWDLSGCSHYDGLRVQLYQDTDLFLVCYDIGNESSLENAVENWIPEVLLEGPKAPFMLVGCKHDLRKNPSSHYNKTKTTCNKTVEKIKAEQVARDWGAKDYIECCAKTGYNVLEVFKSATQVLLSPLDEKNNIYGGLKGLTRFRRRKSSMNESNEIFYFSYDSTVANLLTDKVYPSFTRNYLRRNSDGAALLY